MTMLIAPETNPSKAQRVSEKDRFVSSEFLPDETYDHASRALRHCGCRRSQNILHAAKLIYLPKISLWRLTVFFK